jgi:hypothetical protein
VGQVIQLLPATLAGLSTPLYINAEMFGETNTPIFSGFQLFVEREFKTLVGVDLEGLEIELKQSVVVVEPGLPSAD